MPSEVPSAVPSISVEPSQVPSGNSPRVTSVTVVEPDGVSKTVNCCESVDDNNECQSLLAVAEAESLDECSSVSSTESPSKEVSFVLCLGRMEGFQELYHYISYASLERIFILQKHFAHTICLLSTFNTHSQQPVQTYLPQEFQANLRQRR